MIIFVYIEIVVAIFRVCLNRGSPSKANWYVYRNDCNNQLVNRRYQFGLVNEEETNHNNARNRKSKQCQHSCHTLAHSITGTKKKWNETAIWFTWAIVSIDSSIIVQHSRSSTSFSNLLLTAWLDYIFTAIFKPQQFFFSSYFEYIYT